jgi:chromosome segregation ATPase
VGVSRGTDTAKFASSQPSTQPQPSRVEARLRDAFHERQIARVQVEQGDQTIADLGRQLAQQSVEINQMKAAQARLENDLRVGDATRQVLIQQRTGLTQKLAASQISFQALQEKLDSLAQQSSQDAVRAQAAEATVPELTQLLHDREVALDQKDELLAHDRDIRELMGARDLYVAEVYNVVRNGTQKPCQVLNPISKPGANTIRAADWAGGDMPSYLVLVEYLIPVASPCKERFAT